MALSEMLDSEVHLIELYLACRNLVNLDIMTDTDCFLKIFENVGGTWNLLGQTEIIYNNLNPEFTKTIETKFYFERKQPFKIQAFHADSPTDFKFIGEAEFELSKLMGNKDDAIERELVDTQGKKPNRGQVWVRFEKVSNNSLITLKIEGKKLFSKHWFRQNKNFIDIYKPKQPKSLALYTTKQGDFKFLEMTIPEDQWVRVHRTEWIANNKNPQWMEIKISKSTLCSNMPDIPLMIKVMDYSIDSGNVSATNSSTNWLEDVLSISMKWPNATQTLKSSKRIGPIAASLE